MPKKGERRRDGESKSEPAGRVRDHVGAAIFREAVYPMTKPIAREIVVETRGGTIVGIYCDDRDLRVIVVDWDEYHDQGRAGVVYDADRASSIPEDTKRLVNAAE
jgi:hypothetical protein